MKIRHSSLPKLALCGQYEGAPGSSPAAARGTKLDQAFRHAWTTGEFPDWDLPEEDADAVRWTINQCAQLGGVRDGLLTADDACRVQTAGLEHTGTVDGVAARANWSMDLKSGQIYDYRAQMAAYALGLMQMRFEQTWTTHLLFCDQRQVVTHEWTYQSASDLVRGILANVGAAPVENDYCGWCAKSLTCPARVASKDAALVTVAGLAPTVQDEGFLALLNDPVQVGKFLTACSTLEDFRDAAKAKARELLEAGQPVHGWRLQKARVTEYVDPGHIAHAVQLGQVGAQDAILAGGALSAKKAEALWSAAGAAMPDGIVSRKIGQAPLVAAK
ncbi:Protein of unknown function DUF2800 [uncultured Caudovirales phage]|uniref:Uncharacterized protein n=1 Tax=uncultured Caudovirales phage TaxID=2100421 RepID=A0A6J5NXE3_9CAUD|nr:Protein of unknown function DUF2800 [uncultured Caudovirales phage]CAB4162296.1 Protein of unknown function DUF2800 [uncultured Caudovirales phage]